MKKVVNNHPHHSMKKAIKRWKKNQAKEWTTKEIGIQRYLNRIIPPLLVFIQQCEKRKTGRKEDREATVRRERGWRELNVKPQNKVGKGKELKRGERKLKRAGKQKVETVKTEGFKRYQLKGFGFGLYGVIKCIRSGLYGEDRAVKYFIFISILKLIKNYFKIVEKIQKR